MSHAWCEEERVVEMNVCAKFLSCAQNMIIFN
jgi:hypothetical protein